MAIPGGINLDFASIALQIAQERRLRQRREYEEQQRQNAVNAARAQQEAQRALELAKTYMGVDPAVAVGLQQGIIPPERAPEYIGVGQKAAESTTPFAAKMLAGMLGQGARLPQDIARDKPVKVTIGTPPKLPGAQALGKIWKGMQAQRQAKAAAEEAKRAFLLEKAGASAAARIPLEKLKAEKKAEIEAAKAKNKVELEKLKAKLRKQIIAFKTKSGGGSGRNLLATIEMARTKALQKIREPDMLRGLLASAIESRADLTPAQKAKRLQAIMGKTPEQKAAEIDRLYDELLQRLGLSAGKKSAPLTPAKQKQEKSDDDLINETLGE